MPLQKLVWVVGILVIFCSIYNVTRQHSEIRDSTIIIDIYIYGMIYFNFLVLNNFNHIIYKSIPLSSWWFGILYSINQLYAEGGGNIYF